MTGLVVRRAAPVKGFTLVELLIAVSILGLLMTAAFGSLMLGSKSWRSSIERADTNQDLRTSVDFLRRQFAQLTPLMRNDDGERLLLFTGASDLTRFVAPAPESLGGGLIVVTLAIVRGTDTVGVAFGAVPFDPGLGTQADAGPDWQRMLITELADAKISYFGAPVSDDPHQWHDDWTTEATSFPSVVRLSSTAEDGSPRPDLYFRIRAMEVL